MVAHNASFDISLPKKRETAGNHIPADGSRYGFAGACSAAEPEPLKLDTVAKELKSPSKTITAVDDAGATADFSRFIGRC